jgi:hypothetical protein
MLHRARLLFRTLASPAWDGWRRLMLAGLGLQLLAPHDNWLLWGFDLKTAVFVSTLLFTASIVLFGTALLVTRSLLKSSGGLREVRR